MQEILTSWSHTKAYQNAAATVSRGGSVLVSGLSLLPQAAWAASLFNDSGNSLLFVTTTEEEAVVLYKNILPFVGDQCVLFPLLELLPFATYAQNMELVISRVNVLSRLSRGEKLIVVASIESVSRILVPPHVFTDNHFLLRKDIEVDFETLPSKLIDMGYERVKLTDMAGSFSVRGDIIDVFPINTPQPVRLEFFDDQLCSLRVFSPSAQISLGEIDELLLPPAHELPLNAVARGQAIRRLRKSIRELSAKLHTSGRAQLNERFTPMIDLLEQGIWDSNMESLLPLFYDDAASLLSYFDDGLLVLSEAAKLQQISLDLDSERHSHYHDLLTAGQLLPSYFDNFIDQPFLFADFAQLPKVIFSQLENDDGGLKIDLRSQCFSRDLPSYAANPSAFKDDCQNFRKRNYRLLLSASSEPRIERIRSIIQEIDYPNLQIIEAGFSKGFESSELKLALITENELFAQEKKFSRRRVFSAGERLSSFTDLRVGDYVVHITQGIGRYMGVERLALGNIQKDYIYIQYAGEDKLYLPIDQLDLIQKYIGSDGNAPKLYKLGGNEWQKVKTKVRRSVRDMAEELLALYAKREAVVGYAFSADSVWQKEFEDAFPYTETPDQVKAEEEIKHDMELPKPMDRLLCGDVGYGKTELALRAAFKAVMDAKQVAILVPTTVLAQQHCHTIEERFSGYPVSYGCLSRFATPKQQKEMLSRLCEGKLDIIVGTHRLLSADVKYKDLGLLIVDEEQRFGVSHKEKIKSLKGTVDVLTLSATPIPRTLHMALAGMRDMSIIATPPPDRRPVQTYVVEYHSHLIQEVINKELQRGGQVYFVHNRVHDIFPLATDLASLFPNARIAIAHGQMKERELEQVMLDFVAGTADILVCTTIIESGLDIPNVNTLIVNEADNFGLAQLYQLRGRVGRSERQAFAYFTYQKNKLINDLAKKRLIAIRDFTELGAGFKIAMRDLELRGAGNILGPEQHGHLLAVGFDLYCRLLEEEMAAAEGKEIEESSVSTLLELQIDAYIPDSYIEDSTQKVEVYKRIAAATSFTEIDAIASELQDRYGSFNQPLANLIASGKIKIVARRLRIGSIIQKQGYLEIKLAENHHISGEHLLALSSKWQQRLSFTEKKSFILKFKTANQLPAEKRLDLLTELLLSLQNIVDSKEEIACI